MISVWSNKKDFDKLDVALPGFSVYTRSLWIRTQSAVDNIKLRKIKLRLYTGIHLVSVRV